MSEAKNRSAAPSLPGPAGDERVPQRAVPAGAAVPEAAMGEAATLPPPAGVGHPTAGAGHRVASSVPTDQAADPYLDQVIGERYRIIERLNVERMGLVFRGEHILMRKPVAIKLLHRELGAVGDAVERFRREAEAASRLSHPSIVTVTDFGRATSGELFLVMEYIAGNALSDEIADKGRFAPPRALALARLILRGLTHAHAAGVVHRDLKPANIMLQRRAGMAEGAESLKILDFGIAKMTEGNEPKGDVLTRGGMIFGTPSYMSPEQAAGEQVDHRADLYACGVILYEMLAGRKPFVADDLVKVMAQQVTAPPPPFSRTAPDAEIPAGVEAVVMKALAKNREDRFQSAIEFLQAIDEVERVIGRWAWLRSRAQQTRQMAAAQIRTIWQDGKKRRMVLGALGVMMFLTLVPAFCGRSEIKPKPVVKELVHPLKQADELLAQGKLSAAKGILLQQLSIHPEAGRIHFQLGSIAFLDGNSSQGLQHYRDALKQDAGLRGDPVLLLNVKNLLEDRTLADAALTFLIESVAAPARDVLAAVASTDKRPVFRSRARLACDELGCLRDVDLVESYSLDLRQEKTCAKKREAVKGLGDTGDARAVPILKKAIRTRGTALHRWLGIPSDDCLRKEVKAALAKLGAKED